MERRAKYNARKVTVDGITFDSQKEARRYSELRLAQVAGEISRLLVHPRFELQPAFEHRGKTIKSIYYEADFQYQDNSNGATVIEDTKGFENRVFLIKQKMFIYKYPGLDFRVIK